MTPHWKEAQRYLASGVNSPVRAFRAVGGEPIFIRKGEGPFITGINGKRYIDYCLSWGALLRGHAYGKTVKAVQAQAALGTGYGAPTELETELAKEIQKSFPGMERMRFTTSGTEAAMSAVRLARGITGKDRVLKFEGCYHGHGDALLVKAGSGLATFGSPDSAGIPKRVAALTSVLPYNDVAAAKRFLGRRKDLACILVEPVAANMGVVPALPVFLETLKDGAKKSGALLIFDEVISGFRLGQGGAQHFYRVKPDITILGKIIGGGLPIGAFGAKKEWMDFLSPSGGVYQAGTLSGNPLSMAAGQSVLSGLSSGFYASLNERTRTFAGEMGALLKRQRHEVSVQSIGSMFTIFFGIKKAENFADVRRSDRKKFARFFHHLTANGIYTGPSAFEASFLSSAHSDHELKKTLEVVRQF